MPSQQTLEAVEETMMYILSHIKVAFEFTGTIQRKEVFEYPLNALREIVLNAVVHRDYTSPIDTQIKIFDDKITFFNPGRLYGDITVEKLATDSYQAQTRNKLIAEAFYLTGDIEKYGSGYIRIRNEIAAYPGMKFDFEEMGNGYLVTLSSGTVEGITEQAVLAFCRQPRSTTEIMHHLGLRHREHFRSSILMPLLERQLLRLTIPDKPSSPKQKYITTTSQSES